MTKKLKKICVPHMGYYMKPILETFNSVLSQQQIKVRFVLAPPTTKEAVLRGWRLMDENMCLPAKITLGNMVEAIEKNGVKAFSMWDSCGDCRYKVYHQLHQNILSRRYGNDIEMYRFRARSPLRDLKAIDPGITKRVAINMLWKGLWRLWTIDKEQLNHQANLDQDKPRIGIVGEIYTILEPNANLNLLSKLRKQGAAIHNSLPLSQFVFRRAWHNKFFRRLGLKRPDIDYKLREKAVRETEQYFPEYTVGGHGKESVVNTIYYALAGFDGVVHVQPFPCMPESTVSEFLDEISEDYGIPVNHLTFDQQVGEANLDTRIEALVNMLKLGKSFKENPDKKTFFPGVDKTKVQLEPSREAVSSNNHQVFLGIDVGSVSTKAVVMDRERNIRDQFYLDTSRDPVRALQQGFKELGERNQEWDIQGVITTGSARKLAQAVLNANLSIDEITAQTLGCLDFFPEVRSIIEIGGEDSKFIQLEEGIPKWFNLNSICSAGTGSFFTGAAREFGCSIEEFGQIAKNSQQEVRITGRCGVFAQSDMVTKQQKGYPKEALIRGMCMAMPQNFLNNVARNRKLKAPIMFTGGVASNPGAVEGFERQLGQEVEVHPRNKISGAYGACLYALLFSSQLGATGFPGFEVAEKNFRHQGFECKDCANHCKVSLLIEENKVKATFGSRCRKWERLEGGNIQSEAELKNLIG